jgi:hypothetical protein
MVRHDLFVARSQRKRFERRRRGLFVAPGAALKGLNMKVFDHRLKHISRLKVIERKKKTIILLKENFTGKQTYFTRHYQKIQQYERSNS